VEQLVNTFVSQPGFLIFLREVLARRQRLAFRVLISLLFLGLASGSVAAATHLQNSPDTPRGPGLPFAIADFDGDLRPDTANIQAGANVSGSSDYWIDLELSSAGQQSIQLTAPAGGLLIEARDVNGDHAVDLVLATAWFRQPVAIFLNDGHGSFSRVALTEYPDAFRESGTNFTSGSILAAETLGIAPQSGAGTCPPEKSSQHNASPAGSISASSAGFPAGTFLFSQPGRAPPSELLLA
jgi:hypothetical protein